ncbi:hypothetical protein AgCh_019503 [Apium graveolens]
MIELVSKIAEKKIKEIESLSLTFRGHDLIVNSELKLNYGRRYGLLGLNGCGKSTLLTSIRRREIPISEHIGIFHLTRDIEASDMSSLEEHLVFEGNDKPYTCWTYHGAKKGERRSSNLNSNHHVRDRVDTKVFGDTKGSNVSDKNEIPNDFNEEEQRDHPDMHEKLKDNATLPLWPGCTKFSKLSAVLTLHNLKVGHQVSGVFFTQMLIAKEYVECDECPKCSLKRYKIGNSPTKVMWRWLAPNHRYRNMPLIFNGEVEEQHAPPIPSGDDEFKKKNVFDSLVGTLLSVKGKTKDGLNAWMDMMEMGIKNGLGPVEKPRKKPYLPPATHTLSRDEKRVLLQILYSIKVLEGYSSNIKSLIFSIDFN